MPSTQYIDWLTEALLAYYAYGSEGIAYQQEQLRKLNSYLSNTEKNQSNFFFNPPPYNPEVINNDSIPFPMGWHVFMECSPQHQRDGYYGIAFYREHPETGELEVKIVSRGTWNEDDVIEDLEAYFMQRAPRQFFSGAIPFTEEVIRWLNLFYPDRQKKISFGGHSLGGLIASMLHAKYIDETHLLPILQKSAEEIDAFIAGDINLLKQFEQTFAKMDYAKQIDPESYQNLRDKCIETIKYANRPNETTIASNAIHHSIKSIQSNKHIHTSIKNYLERELSKLSRSLNQIKRKIITTVKNTFNSILKKCGLKTEVTQAVKKDFDDKLKQQQTETLEQLKNSLKIDKVVTFESPGCVEVINPLIQQGVISQSGLDRLKTHHFPLKTDINAIDCAFTEASNDVCIPRYIKPQYTIKIPLFPEMQYFLLFYTYFQHNIIGIIKYLEKQKEIPLQIGVDNPTSSYKRPVGLFAAYLYHITYDPQLQIKHTEYWNEYIHRAWEQYQNIRSEFDGNYDKFFEFYRDYVLLNWNKIENYQFANMKELNSYYKAQFTQLKSKYPQTIQIMENILEEQFKQYHATEEQVNCCVIV